MALDPQTPSKHNQMNTLSRFIKHPKSTNFDGEKDRPSKRQKTGDGPKKPPPTPRRIIKREIPDSDAEEENVEVKEEGKERKTDLESALPPVKTGEDAVKEYEAFKASQEDTEVGAEDRLEKRSWVRGKSSLYVDAFNLALDTVLDEESHLFDEAETELFRIWKELSYEAQYLQVDLYQNISTSLLTSRPLLDTYASSSARPLPGIA